jgi:hypothetical protein
VPERATHVHPFICRTATTQDAAASPSVAASAAAVEAVRVLVMAAGRELRRQAERREVPWVGEGDDPRHARRGAGEHLHHVRMVQAVMITQVAREGRLAIGGRRDQPVAAGLAEDPGR